jgi:hypothetical protein
MLHLMTGPYVPFRGTRSPEPQVDTVRTTAERGALGKNMQNALKGDF